MKDIELETAILKSSYSENYKNYIKILLTTNYCEENNITKADVYLANEDGNYLFIIKYNLQIKFYDKYYKVGILTYLPINYPDILPEFYILNTANNKIGINNYYLEQNKIDKNNYKINIKSFTNSSKIDEIIKKLNENFHTCFPVYLRKNEEKIVSGKCILNLNKVSKVLIKSEKNLKDYEYILTEIDHLKDKLMK